MALEPIDERVKRFMSGDPPLKLVFRRKESLAEALSLTEDEMQLLYAYRTFLCLNPPETIFRWTTPPGDQP